MGRCQCGNLTYSVSAEPFVAYTCHCRECQRLSSSAFNTCAQVPAESVQIMTGMAATRTRATETGNRLTMWFCSNCGSALYCQNSARPRINTVFVGTLDQPEAVQVSAHIWLKHKLPWFNVPSGHRSFDGPGDWTADYAEDLQRYQHSTS
ncbi:MAG: GFA family protein [Pseudomonadales bacterium]